MPKFRNIGNLRFLVAGCDVREDWWPFALCWNAADARYIAAFYGQRCKVYDLANP